MNMRSVALYLHIPFCAAKCAYCDFASWPGKQEMWDRYLDAMLDEMDAWRDRMQGRKVQTVFLGGGTPSLLPGEMIERLMQGVYTTFEVSPDAEITMEANPGTLTEEKLLRCRRAGINRISIGAQSMNDRLLKELGRIHCAEDVREAVAMARKAGFDNLNLDLMYALPGQTVEDWMDTLREAAKLEPEHISAYSLILEEGTPLADRVGRGESVVPEEDAAVEMQRAAVEWLAANGWQRYEISNYARRGYECRHNIVYWQRGDYLGFGCAAHSLMDGERFENPRELSTYLDGKRGLCRELLSREDIMEETLMLSTRMVRGLDLRGWKVQFGEDFSKGREMKLAQLESMGLTERHDGFLRLTTKGMELQNAVVVELMA